MWLIQLTEFLQERPQLDAWRDVHLQNPNSGSPDGRASQNQSPITQEMLIPDILARMVEPGQFARVGIYARHIGAFGPVADATGQRKIFQRACSLMFDGNDMIYVQWTRRLVLLSKQTVFTAVSGSETYRLTDGFFHHADA